jgi:hypothetical protein
MAAAPVWEPSKVASWSVQRHVVSVSVQRPGVLAGLGLGELQAAMKFSLAYMAVLNALGVLALSVSMISCRVSTPLSQLLAVVGRVQRGAGDGIEHLGRRSH